MRVPTLPEFLFISSMVAFVAFVATFSSQLLDGEPLCELNLLSEKQEICTLRDNLVTGFRVVIHSGGNSKTVTLKVPITISVSNNSESINYENIMPKSAGTSGGKRYYSNLNYGIYELPDSLVTTVSVSVNASISEFSLFNVKLLKNPTNFNVHLLDLIFLVILFFSIYTRKKIFLNGIGKPLPYVLYFFVVILTLTWAL